MSEKDPVYIRYECRYQDRTYFSPDPDKIGYFDMRDISAIEKSDGFKISLLTYSGQWIYIHNTSDYIDKIFEFLSKGKKNGYLERKEGDGYDDFYPLKALYKGTVKVYL